MKYKIGGRYFWSRGYYVSSVGANKQVVQKYIQHQETEDLISNQISMVEYYAPFKKWLETNQCRLLVYGRRVEMALGRLCQYSRALAYKIKPPL